MKSRGRRLFWVAAGVVAILAVSAGISMAQQIWAGGYGTTPPRYPTPSSFTGGFNFFRAIFSTNCRGETGWGTDYPRADLYFSPALAELTQQDGQMIPGPG